MSNAFPSGDPVDDPLALFGAEEATPSLPPAPARPAPSRPLQPIAEKMAPAPRPAAAPVAEPIRLRTESPIAPDVAAGITYPTASVLEKLTAAVPEPTAQPRDLSIEVMGPPPPAGSVSFDHICTVKGLGFVEGVALIQATCDAVNMAGPRTGVPELHGLFLTSQGQVVLHGAPTGEPPARELARLLHQLVTPNLMPPAGRLFVGRWSNSDTHDLTAFASELAYFARPNSHEMLMALHGRCDEARAAVAELRPIERPRAEIARRHTDNSTAAIPRPVFSFHAWVQSHKPEVTAAVTVIAAATVTAIGTLIWSPKPVQAAKPPIESVVAADQTSDALTESNPGAAQTLGAATPGATSAARLAGRTGGSANQRAVSQNRGATTQNRGATSQNRGTASNRGGAVPPSARTQVQATQQAPSVESQVASGAVPQAGAPVLVPSRQAPDLQIYSSADNNVEPPRLRSAEIPEVLIKGFDQRTNKIELVISERGEVQQARMIDGPQRMPDIMLLSRAKELLFDPAIRNGVAVRYRLIMSWNVTP